MEIARVRVEQDGITIDCCVPLMSHPAIGGVLTVAQNSGLE